MIQAARSGKQNIIEGGGQSRTSKGQTLSGILLQIQKAEEAFVNEGGYSEKLFKKRLEAKMHR